MAAGGVRHPPGGTPFNITNGAAYPNGDYNADNNSGDRPNTPGASGVKTSGWTTEEYLPLAGIFKATDFPKPAAGTNGTLSFATPTGVPATWTSACRCPSGSSCRPATRSKSGWSTFNVFNRVNLNNPSSDLSSSTFGTVTSQLATRAAHWASGSGLYYQVAAWWRPGAVGGASVA